MSIGITSHYNTHPITSNIFIELLNKNSFFSIYNDVNRCVFMHLLIDISLKAYNGRARIRHTIDVWLPYLTCDNGPPVSSDKVVCSLICRFLYSGV